MQMQLLQLGNRYKLWEGENWEVLTQIEGRALSGRAARIFTEKVENARAPHTGTTTEEAPETHFTKFLQECNAKYFGKNAAKEQKEAMENGDLKYSHNDHLAVVERLFEINEMFHLLGPNTWRSSA
jgi:hypothetical protein